MKNNKGFMLAEAVITSTVVLTTLIGLYATFSRLYNLYNIRTTYFDIDGIYAIKGIINNLLIGSNPKLNSVLSRVGRTPKSIINGAACDTNIFNDGNSKDYCASLVTTYNVNKMYVVKYNKDSVRKLKNEANIHQTFKDYIDYVSNYYPFNDSNADDSLENKINIDDGYKYLFIVEYKNGDDYYYSNLGLG